MKNMKIIRSMSVLMAAAIALGNPVSKAQAAVDSGEISTYSRYISCTISAQGSKSLGSFTSSSGTISFDVSSISGRIGIIARDSNNKVVAAQSPVSTTGTYTLIVDRNKMVYLYIQNEDAKEVSLEVTWY